MKKLFIAMVGLAGVAAADTSVYRWDFAATNTTQGQTGVLGGSVTNTFVTESVDGVGTAIKKGSSAGSYWEVNTSSFLKDAIDSATTVGGGTLTLTVDYYYGSASRWGETILHAGAHNTGLSFGVAPQGALSIVPGTPSDSSLSGAAAEGITLTAGAWNTITYTIVNNTWTVSLNGSTSVAKQVGTLSWASSAAEQNKYCIGVKASGYSSEVTGLNDNGSKIANLSISYQPATVPEPTTATLSLLALAGLAARRRRA